MAIQGDDKITEGHCRSILGWVNEKIRAASLNVFVFLKAWPIIDPEGNHIIGHFTGISPNFKQDLCKTIQDT